MNVEVEMENTEKQSSPVVAMAASGTPPHSQHDDEEPSQNQDPNPTESQEPQQSPPQQLPDSESLETLALPIPLPSPVHDQGVQNLQQLDKDDDSILILGQQLKQKDDHQSGTSHSTLIEPIILTDDSINPPPPPAPPLSSPTNPQRRFNKRKKAVGRKTYKRKKPSKKFQNLTDNLKPIPFIPTKELDFEKHQDVLKRLGLLDFSKIVFDRSIRTDLIVQLIVNYDSKKRSSYVNDVRILVNRADLARALKLPAPKQDKGSTSFDEVDLDSEVFSDEAIQFIDDFVSNYMLLHENPWVVPTEIANWIRCIRDGHPEKMDSASLIWYMVEKELTQGDKLSDCYYASHLQHLIKSQRDSLFVEEDDDGVEDDVEEIVKADEDKEEKQENEEKQEKEVDEEKQEKEVKAHDMELSLGPDVGEMLHEEVKKDDEIMVDAEECSEMEEQGNQKNVLQRCQSSDLNNYEERKVEEVEHEQIEQVDDEDEEEQEHVKELEEEQEQEQEEEQEQEQQEEEEEEEEEEEDGCERVDEGFEIGPNDDSMDRDGLTDNFLGVETHNIPFNSHGMSSMDLFGSRDNSFMSHGGPFFNNGGKRVMEPEEDVNHLDINNKRLKAEEIWGEKENDFGVCMNQMQRLMEKAKMIYDSKEQSYVHLQYSQELAMNEMNDRQNFMQLILKSKDEELEKKNAEVFRLERELYLMADLLSGYKKALLDTRSKFSEYRKRYALQEEPLYKDVGPGGLVLSTRELEKQRLKLEEDMREVQILAKTFEEDCVYQMKMHDDKVLSMFDKLVSIGNEVKQLKEIATQSKEKQKILYENVKSGEFQENLKSLNEHDLSLEEEEIQEARDEIVKNDASVESLEARDEIVKNDASVQSPEARDEIVKNDASVQSQEARDEIVKNDASVESVPPHDDEQEKKEDGEDQIGKEC